MGKVPKHTVRVFFLPSLVTEGLFAGAPVDRFSLSLLSVLESLSLFSFFFLRFGFSLSSSFVGASFFLLTFFGFSSTRLFFSELMADGFAGCGAGLALCGLLCLFCGMK